MAKSADVCLTIATGEVRKFGNLLLEIEVVETEPVDVAAINKLDGQWMH